jgi:hypothetical protein
MAAAARYRLLLAAYECVLEVRAAVSTHLQLQQLLADEDQEVALHAVRLLTLGGFAGFARGFGGLGGSAASGGGWDGRGGGNGSSAPPQLPPLPRLALSKDSALTMRVALQDPCGGVRCLAMLLWHELLCVHAPLHDWLPGGDVPETAREPLTPGAGLLVSPASFSGLAPHAWYGRLRAEVVHAALLQGFGVSVGLDASLHPAEQDAALPLGRPGPVPGAGHGHAGTWGSGLGSVVSPAGSLGPAELQRVAAAALGLRPGHASRPSRADSVASSEALDDDEIEDGLLQEAIAAAVAGPAYRRQAGWLLPPAARQAAAGAGASAGEAAAGPAESEVWESAIRLPHRTFAQLHADLTPVIADAAAAAASASVDVLLGQARGAGDPAAAAQLPFAVMLLRDMMAVGGVSGVWRALPYALSLAEVQPRSDGGGAGVAAAAAALASAAAHGLAAPSVRQQFLGSQGGGSIASAVSHAVSQAVSHDGLLLHGLLDSYSVLQEEASEEGQASSSTRRTRIEAHSVADAVFAAPALLSALHAVGLPILLAPAAKRGSAPGLSDAHTTEAATALLALPPAQLQARVTAALRNSPAARWLLFSQLHEFGLSLPAAAAAPAECSATGPAAPPAVRDSAVPSEAAPAVASTAPSTAAVPPPPPGPRPAPPRPPTQSARIASCGTDRESSGEAAAPAQDAIDVAAAASNAATHAASSDAAAGAEVGGVPITVAAPATPGGPPVAQPKSSTAPTPPTVTGLSAALLVSLRGQSADGAAVLVYLYRLLAVGVPRSHPRGYALRGLLLAEALASGDPELVADADAIVRGFDSAAARLTAAAAQQAAATSASVVGAAAAPGEARSPQPSGEVEAGSVLEEEGQTPGAEVEAGAQTDAGRRGAAAVPTVLTMADAGVGSAAGSQACLDEDDVAALLQHAAQQAAGKRAAEAWAQALMGVALPGASHAPTGRGGSGDAVRGASARWVGVGAGGAGMHSHLLAPRREWSLQRAAFAPWRGDAWVRVAAVDPAVSLALEATHELALAELRSLASRA